MVDTGTYNYPLNDHGVNHIAQQLNQDIHID